ncbi:ras and Rab interactor 1 [Pimephales promelas]|uniref:ras and Rab interactor 1 n=1 Tax=Pimephales promelas TaxID=90988 RepID=UPI0019557CC4|nr:ras and Rab interactor 1 [Pimephales promelas]XP_039549665.1 ras and Rab interactor 1 [Pimephales promelas]XP_039549666.1 ras and Rab interactor 1 [Pimephales promelas]KAG1940527.1 ras and Rab interactor [Pimephales promelas]KAG1940528.1 ras and Rab interactor [Pimephales promelas]KAG1940529.1 ras and Rab interactor [Pimephales promelas]KAG1940530.1 ras and Rab interactor [Pimephales promelas]
MQGDPVYDYPDSRPVGDRRACPQRGSQRSISVLDRLLLTHPVWLQLSGNSATALHILRREPPGTFLVRKSSTSQKKMLCVRLADDSTPSFIKQVVIREEDSAFSLESSAISFPDLCRLVAFYCVSRDVLPFTLELPEAIAKASSHKQLESISHMGVEFWSSHLNVRGPRNEPPAADKLLPPTPSPEDCSAPININPTPFQELCPIQTRSPCELNYGGGKGLCFVNPLFLQDYPGRNAMRRRHHFKTSIKVRVSTENSSPLSPPVIPPPPPPLLAKAKCKARLKALKKTIPPVPVQADEEAIKKTEQEATDYMQPCVVSQKKTMVTPTLSPTAEEDDYQMPKALQKMKILEQKGPEEEEDEEEELVLEQRHAPSLSELDSSSSLSSLDETEDSPERPPLTRGTSNPVMSPPRKSMSALRKMSAAFISFFAPEKRVARMVEDLSRDRRMAFGALVQDFLRQQREALKPQCLTSPVQLLQDLRLFISQAKAFLLECGELEPPIETLLTENEKDQALEKALFRCVLKPLKPQIDAALRTLHKQDGSFQRMADNLQRAKGASPQKLFGVEVGVPDAQGIEKIKHKLTLMQRAYSPIDKVLLLLQICKLIYKAMKNKSGQEFGADDFLPALSYVMVLCNMPEISLEVEYMMELLESSWLTGEGGYYLTSLYASLSLIQSQPEDVPPSGLTNQARESLKEWSRRRSNETTNQKDNKLPQRFIKVLFQDDDRSIVKTLMWKTSLDGEAMAQLCASKFGVDRPEDYSLYWRKDGELTPLPSNTQVQDLQSMCASGVPLIYQVSNQAESSQKLNRGGAVDLTEEAS